MDFSGKRLLFLGGPNQVIKAVEQAKKMGVYTIVTDTKEKAKAKQFADEALPFGVTDTDSIISWCRQNPVDGVLNFGVDPAQKPCIVICEALGLPHFGTLEQVEYLSNKQAFKALCLKCGVDVIRSYTEDDINAAFDDYPLLIKPAQNCGSRGGSVCYSPEAALAGIEKAKKLSANGKVIIEKYMEGYQDFTVEYCFVGGTPYLVRAADRYTGDKAYNLDRQAVATAAPSKYLDMYLSNVHGRVISMLRSIGIRDGVLFLQGFVDGDTVRFYDPAYRFPGTDYEKNLLSATGVNLMERAVSFALGSDLPAESALDDCYHLGGKCAISLFFTSRPGKIAYFDGLDEIRKIPGVVTAIQKEAVGSVIPDSGDVAQRVAEVGLVVADDKKTVEDTVLKVQSLLKVRDENGDNMLISLLDPMIFRAK
ncbi:MAG: hypothetical protein K6G90_00710 [Clostridia bacterium]|nr:hypothetical protein [Clostridia bacterium]